MISIFNFFKEWISLFFSIFWRGVKTFFITAIPYFFWGINNTLGSILLITIVIDTVLGFAKGWGNGNVISYKLKKIAKKFITYGSAIICAAQIQHAFYVVGIPYSVNLNGHPLTFVILIILGLIATETISIIENLAELGIKFPSILTEHIKVLKTIDMEKARATSEEKKNTKRTKK